jgi:hypothetical protein
MSFSGRENMGDPTGEYALSTVLDAWEGGLLAESFRSP